MSQADAPEPPELRVARGLGDAAPDDHARAVAAWASGRAAWPDVNVDPVAFGARLRAILDDGGLAEVRADDVYLAVACVAGQPAALAAFEQVHVAPVRS